MFRFTRGTQSTPSQAPGAAEAVPTAINGAAVIPQVSASTAINFMFVPSAVNRLRRLAYRGVAGAHGLLVPLGEQSRREQRYDGVAVGSCLRPATSVILLQLAHSTRGKLMPTSSRPPMSHVDALARHMSMKIKPLCVAARMSGAVAAVAAFASALLSGAP